MSGDTRAGELRVALAGAGRMARAHLAVLQGLPRARVVGVADPSVEARDSVAAAFPGTRTYARLEELLATAPEVVHVCTPLATHGRVAEDALDAGCHLYVEKPVTPTTAELAPLLEKARKRERLLCAGHQVLFEAPYRRLVELLPALGRPVHVESRFAFRPVRTAAGRRPLTAAEQLVDVLPHPTYLLLDLLERVVPAGTPEPGPMEVTGGGTLHLLVRRGDLVGTLVTTLEGRPVEHSLVVQGTNGTLQADFVRGTVQRLLGPGSSGIDKASTPYRMAAQLGVGTTAALLRRVLRGGGSYPGLAGILADFHDAIREGRPSPTPPEQIRGVVAVCEAAGERLSRREIRGTAGDPGPPPEFLVTGGTGLLGREVARELREAGRGVRVVARRLPSRANALEGVDYRTADLSEPLPDGLLEGIRGVVHCAAETAGGREAHRRNSIDAAEHLLRAAAAGEVETFVHVSSVAVLGPGGRRPLSDGDPLHPEPERLGPYAWGKAESERRVARLARELGVRLRIARPVPLIDPAAFSPPGRLGRRVGNLFVAVGSPREPLVVAGAEETARGIARIAAEPEGVPSVVNLVPSRPPSRGTLLRELQRAHPELRVVRLPGLLLHPLSWAAVLVQKALHPRRPAIRIVAAFRSVRYEPGPGAELMAPRVGPEPPRARALDPSDPRHTRAG